MNKTKIGLGKGLSALMGEDLELRSAPLDVSDVRVVFMDIQLLVPGGFQPRREFDEEALLELANSIREKGVLQPLLVRPYPKKEGKYEIIAGERRFRASQEVGLTEIPVLIKNFDDKMTMEVALIENLQREDLNPFEEAKAYERLMEEFSYTQEALSKVVGKSRSHIANMTRLLDLPDNIKRYVLKKELTMGHARALLGALEPENLADHIVKKGLNVRQTEKLVAAAKNPNQKEKKESTFKKDSDILTLEKELTRILNADVSILWGSKGGKVTISCKTLDQLDTILQQLMQKN